VLAAFASVAIWEVTRAAGRANILFGLWLVVAPWVLDYGSVIPLINDFTVGITMIALARTRVTVGGKFGGGWSSLWKDQSGARDTQLDARVTFTCVEVFAEIFC
jgi:hypothetical protein